MRPRHMPLPAPALARLGVGLGAAAVGVWKAEPPGQYALVVIGLLLAASGVIDLVRQRWKRRW